MNCDCIILAGGLGTRLRSVVAEKPKVLAPINEKAFLYYVIRHLQENKINNIILSTGYLHEQIEYWCKENFPSINFEFAIEEEPLGTGGGILNAMQKAKYDHVLILNGDTFFDIDYEKLYTHHTISNAACSLGLKYLENFNRYGCVQLNEKNQVTGFMEKSFRESGLINAGVYLVNRNLFLQQNFPAKFSFEKEYLEVIYSTGNLYGFSFENYFIDIGIPEDFEKAQNDFKQLFP